MIRSILMCSMFINTIFNLTELAMYEERNVVRTKGRTKKTMRTKQKQQNSGSNKIGEYMNSSQIVKLTGKKKEF